MRGERVLVTGAAGFIGFHLTQRLINDGNQVLGLDNLNNYYDVELKNSRLGILEKLPEFEFIKLDIADRSSMEALFRKSSFNKVFHLAAQAGVRHSLTNPHAYVDSNLTGFVNILEGCRRSAVKHLIYASSSSVYGANTKLPFSVSDSVDHPLSLYAATKKANELMAHSYAHLYQLPCTGLRFFTVYGPWGRPDMAYFIFTRAILEGQPIHIFNNGDMKRDFTYIDDVVEGIVRVGSKIPNGHDTVPYSIYNIGNNQPVALLRMIEILEHELGRKAERILLPPQAGDVPSTFADIGNLAEAVGFEPRTSIELGLQKFVEWYKERRA